MDSCYKQSEEYINLHVKNVQLAYNFLINALSKKSRTIKFNNEDYEKLKLNILLHDRSKLEEEEFVPYSNYFFGDKQNRDVKRFKKAVALHKSRNPHHPEYWYDKTGCPQDMPDIYIFEMVCDWWSFSINLAQGNKDDNSLYETIDWYNKHGKEFKLSATTKRKTEYLLNLIKKSKPTLQKLQIFDKF